MATATQTDETDLRQVVEKAIRTNGRFLIEKEIKAITEECVEILKRFIADNNLQRPF